MKRLVLALLLANVVFFGWSRGWFESRPVPAAAGDPTGQGADSLRPVPLQRLDAVPEKPAEPMTGDAARREAAPMSPAIAPVVSDKAGGRADDRAGGRTPEETLEILSDRLPESASAPVGRPTGFAPAPLPPDSGSDVPALPAAADDRPGAVDAAARGAPRAHGAAVSATSVCRDFAAIEIEPARRLRAALEAAGARVGEREVETGSSYLVYLPPAVDAGQARENLERMRSIGRDDAFIIRDGPLLFGISLGLFRYESAAQVLLDRLGRADEHRAVIAARPPFLKRIALQARWTGDAAVPDAPELAKSLGERFAAAVQDCG